MKKINGTFMFKATLPIGSLGVQTETQETILLNPQYRTIENESNFLEIRDNSLYL